LSSYQVLARKWRPQRFEDVIGQRGVTQTLRNAIAAKRIAQSFVFSGPRGVGKTTTIAKVAQREADDGRKIVLAAADTFRAAAAEQLATWADRVGAELVRGQEGADPGSIVFDAMSAATSRGADLVLVDTAGRLHTKVNLMNELEKLRRIVERTPGALKEVLLVLDATTGQNGLSQAREFGEAVDVTGVVLTKLDEAAGLGVALRVLRKVGRSLSYLTTGQEVPQHIEPARAQRLAELVLSGVGGDAKAELTGGRAHP